MRVLFPVVLVAGMLFGKQSLLLCAQVEDIGVSVEHLSKRYCRGDDDVGILSLEGNLLYTNKGVKVYLIARKPQQVEYIRLTPQGRSAADKTITISETNALPDSREMNTATANDFALIKPGGSYTAPVSFSFPFGKPGGAGIQGLPGDGEYLLSVSVSSWQGTKRQAAEIETRLSLGAVLVAPFWSAPSQLLIESHSAPETCGYGPTL